MRWVCAPTPTSMPVPTTPHSTLGAISWPPGIQAKAGGHSLGHDAGLPASGTAVRGFHFGVVPAAAWLTLSGGGSRVDLTTADGHPFYISTHRADGTPVTRPGQSAQVHTGRAGVGSMPRNSCSTLPRGAGVLHTVSRPHNTGGTQGPVMQSASVQLLGVFTPKPPWGRLHASEIELALVSMLLHPRQAWWTACLLRFTARGE